MSKPAFYIREKVKVHNNLGNPSDPDNGHGILTVYVMESVTWSDDPADDEYLKGFGGCLTQDDAEVRAQAAEYLKSQAAVDAAYYDRYQAFIARMDKTEWEY
jgi:hypothetical protein